MKLKYMFYTLLLFSSLSCTFVFFESPQPLDAEILSKFPKEVTGKYALKLKNYIDTITISDSSISYNLLMIGSAEFSESDLGNILKLDPKTSVLKKSGEYYILSMKNAEEDTLWLVYPFRMKGNNLVFHHMMLNSDDEAENIAKIKEFTKVVELRDSSETDLSLPLTGCILNPTKEEFQMLLDKKMFSKFELKRVKERQ